MVASAWDTDTLGNPGCVVNHLDPPKKHNDIKEYNVADNWERFCKCAVDVLSVDAAKVTPDAKFGDDLDADSLDLVELVMALEEQIRVLVEKGERRVSPFLVPMMMANAAGAAISMRYGLRGPNETICTACAASTHSIGYAARQIAWGKCDAVVTGGSEAAGVPIALASFGNMTALSTSGSSRPFDAERDGFVLGEGAAVLVLEEWEHALARGATIIGEVLGAASNADAHHITAPSPGGVGAIACMELALADAGLSPSDIKQINAHGTSTPLNDAAEAAAIAKVFGNSTPTVSTKGVTGHALGAAGALEAAAVLLSMQHRLIPPTAGTVNVDPEFSIDIVTGAPRPWEPGPTLSNSFGFGGHNGCIVLAPKTRPRSGRG